jgi:F-type H+-transporting ATPase subunit delta
MLENPTFSRPYAKAIFSIAVEDNNLQKWSDILRALADVTKDSKIKEFLADPRIDWQGRFQVFAESCAKFLDEHGRNFIKTLTLHRRLPCLPDIYELYEELRLKHEQIVKASIISAIKLEAEQKAKLEQALQKRLRVKIISQYQEDNELLGGVIIRIGDRVIDGSVHNKLKRLRKYLWH